VQYADCGARETKLKIIDNKSVHFLPTLFVAFGLSFFAFGFLQGVVSNLQAMHK